MKAYYCGRVSSTRKVSAGADAPARATVVAKPCLPAAGAQSERPKPHDMEKLRSSGLLDRLGYKVEPATIHTTFRDPDTVHRALRASKGG